jgi:hypothetical protein
MLEELFFILGFANNLFLIFIFLIRKDKMVLLKRFGWVYLLLAIPAVYGILLVIFFAKRAHHAQPFYYPNNREYMHTFLKIMMKK